MLRFSLLGSGSSGNAMLVRSASGKILVDCGLSLKQLVLRTAAIGESIEDLDAVFITHEHGDHVLGLGTLARRFNVPVYMTEGTHAALPDSVGKLPNVIHFEAGETVAVDGLALTSFSVSHDAADPVSFVINSGGVQLGLATDLGHAPAMVKRRLEGSHALVLESNYCHELMRQSPYPAAVRQRIMGSQGHLSNSEMNSLLDDLLHEALRLVVLVHISQENNREDLAHRMAARVLEGHAARLVVASRERPTELFCVV